MLQKKDSLCRRWAAFLAVFTISFTTAPTAAAYYEAPADLAAEAWYGAAAEYACAMGYLQPDGEGNFSPSKPVSMLECVAALASGQASIALLPQPFVTVAQSQVEGLRVALDLSAEWDALDNGSRLITSVLVARKAFADEHPAALAAFLEDYAASTDYANEHPAEAAVLVEKYGIVKAAVAEKALPQCNLVCITGVDMKVAVGGYLQTLYDLKTEAVGGAMPGDGFYWMGA